MLLTEPSVVVFLFIEVSRFCATFPSNLMCAYWIVCIVKFGGVTISIELGQKFLTKQLDMVSLLRLVKKL